jgi:hypothetical protein
MSSPPSQHIARPTPVLQLQDAFGNARKRGRGQLDELGRRLPSDGSNLRGSDPVRPATRGRGSPPRLSMCRIEAPLKRVVVQTQRLDRRVQPVPLGGLHGQGPQTLRDPRATLPSPTPSLEALADSLQPARMTARRSCSHPLSSTLPRHDSGPYQTPHHDSCRLAGRTRATAAIPRSRFPGPRAGRPTNQQLPPISEFRPQRPDAISSAGRRPSRRRAKMADRASATTV